MAETPRIAKRSRKGPAREAFYVCIALPKGTGDDQDQSGPLTAFVPATDHIGTKMPFSKPLVTSFVWSYPDVVAFSVLQIPKRSQPRFAAADIKVPYGSLTRLERRSREIKIGDDEIVVEVEGHQEPYRVGVVRDENNVMELTMLDADGAPASDSLFELGRSASRLSFYLKSPVVDRILAVAFTGHFGRGEQRESVLRVVAKAMNTLRNLSDFSALARLSTVDVPALPGSGFARAKVGPKPESQLACALYSEAGGTPELVVGGMLHVEVNLSVPSQDMAGLLLNLSPSPELAEHFEAYRSIAHTALAEQLTMRLGVDFIREVNLDVVLGEVSEGTTATILDALKQIGRLDLTPTRYAAGTAAATEAQPAAPAPTPAIPYAPPVAPGPAVTTAGAASAGVAGAPPVEAAGDGVGA